MPNKDIFLSYARKDRARILPLVRALEATGWTLFWDRTIPTGKTWSEILEAEITTCRVVVVAWSKHSVNSEWVREEANEGKTRRVLYPLLIDRVVPPFGYRQIQAADFVNWDGDTQSKSFKDLVRDIGGTLGSPSADSGPQQHVAEAPDPDYREERPAKRVAAEGSADVTKGKAGKSGQSKRGKTDAFDLIKDMFQAGKQAKEAGANERRNAERTDDVPYGKKREHETPGRSDESGDSNSADRQDAGTEMPPPIRGALTAFGIGLLGFFALAAVDSKFEFSNFALAVSFSALGLLMGYCAARIGGRDGTRSVAIGTAGGVVVIIVLIATGLLLSDTTVKDRIVAIFLSAALAILLGGVFGARSVDDV